MKNRIPAGSGTSPFVRQEKNLYAPLSGNESCQVLVLGGGLCGLVLASVFVREGFETTVVTRGNLGGARRRYSDGLLQCDVGGGLQGLRRRVGNPAALSVWRTMYDGLEGLETLVKNADLRCGFRRRDTLLFTAGSRTEALREEYLLRRHSGFAVQFMEENDLFSFPFRAGLWTENAGAELDPVAFAADLASYLSVSGAALHGQTRIDTIKAAENGFSCRGNGYEIRAEWVVDVRGLAALEGQSGIGQPETVFSVATPPGAAARGWYRQCLLTEADTGICMRTTPDGRMLASGAESRLLRPSSVRDESFPRRGRYRRLERRLEEMFPDADAQKDVLWFSRTRVRTPDGLPYLGQDRDMKGLYYAWFFGPAGFLFAEPAGRLLCAHRKGAALPALYSL